MTLALTLPVAEATLFTAGCLLIHLARRHAETVTAVLACLIMVLVMLIGIASAPDAFVRANSASAIADGGFIAANALN